VKTRKSEDADLDAFQTFGAFTQYDIGHEMNALAFGRQSADIDISRVSWGMR
jgi:hypothetical protein